MSNSAYTQNQRNKSWILLILLLLLISILAMLGRDQTASAQQFALICDEEIYAGICDYTLGIEDYKVIWIDPKDPRVNISYKINGFYRAEVDK